MQAHPFPSPANVKQNNPSGQAVIKLGTILHRPFSLTMTSRKKQNEKRSYTPPGTIAFNARLIAGGRR